MAAPVGSARAPGLVDIPCARRSSPPAAPCRASIVEACRAAPLPAGVDAGITTLPDVLIARCLAPDTERATMWFGALWRVLRPALAGRAATPLRIWST